MWKILLGVYIIVLVLIIIMLWSALVLSKRADRNRELHTQSGAGLKFGDKDRSADNEAVELQATSDLPEKMRH